jgi:hypothetical protein
VGTLNVHYIVGVSMASLLMITRLLRLGILFFILIFYFIF